MRTAIRMIWLYLRLAWAMKTPLVLLLDLNYRKLKPSQMDSIYASLKLWQYQKDYRDCDSYALAYKFYGELDKLNGIGLVFGLWKGIHSWNVVWVEGDGFVMVEPQNGSIVKRRWLSYHPLIVIL